MDDTRIKCEEKQSWTLWLLQTQLLRFGMEYLDGKPRLVLLPCFGNEGHVRALTGVPQVRRVRLGDNIHYKQVTCGLNQKTRGLAEYRIALRQIHRCDGSAIVGLNHSKRCIRHLAERCAKSGGLERSGPAQQ